MERDSITLTPKEILNHVFASSSVGYDSNEVDKFLDRVIHDYEIFAKYQADSQSYIEELESQLRKEKEINANMALDLAKANSRVKGIQEKDFSVADSSNIDLLNYINRLEKALHSLGVTDTSVYKR